MEINRSVEKMDGRRGVLSEHDPCSEQQQSGENRALHCGRSGILPGTVTSESGFFSRASSITSADPALAPAPQLSIRIVTPWRASGNPPYENGIMTGVRID